MNKVDAIDKYLARVLMVSFFLPMKLQVLATMGAGLYFVIRAVTTRQTGKGKDYLWALLLGGTFLLFVLALPFTPQEYMKVVRKGCEHRVSLLLMPVLFAAIGPALRAAIMKEIMFFVYGCVVSCIIANGLFIYHFYFTGSLQVLTHVDYRTAIHAYTDVHPTYLSMYLCLAICILFLSPKLNMRVHPFIVNTLLFTSFLFLLALGAKTPILALFLIIVHYAWVHRKELYRFRATFIGLLATAVAAWAFVPFLRQRVSEMTQFFGKAQVGNTTDNSVYARKAIWNMDIALLKEHWLTGVGPARINAVMEIKSFFYSMSNSLPVIYHDPHNEYFYQWLCFGVLGIAVLAGILLVHFRQAVRFKDDLYLYLLIILCATFFTESVLSLQRGIMFYAVFTSLMFYPKPAR